MELGSGGNVSDMKIDVLALAKESWTEFNADKSPRLAAAIAYAAVFAIAPLFIIVIAIAGWYFGLANGGHGHHIVQEKIVSQISASMGRDAGETVNGMIAASYKNRNGLLASIVGWILVLVGASGVFAALQDALNTVWHIEPKRSGIMAVVREKIAAIGMVIGLGIVMLASFLASATLTFVSTYLSGAFPFPGLGALLLILNYVVSVGVIGLLFAMIFRYLPDRSIAWHDVLSGAFTTAVLFEVGQALISLYLGKSGVASGYGAAGAVLVILLWAYYSALVLLLGAEFTKVWARRHGSDAAVAAARALEPTRVAVGIR